MENNTILLLNLAKVSLSLLILFILRYHFVIIFPVDP